MRLAATMLALVCLLTLGAYVERRRQEGQRQGHDAPHLPRRGPDAADGAMEGWGLGGEHGHQDNA